MKPTAFLVLAGLFLGSPLAAPGQEPSDDPLVARLIARLREGRDPPRPLLQELVRRGATVRKAIEEARHRVPEFHVPLVVRLVEMIDTNEHASRSWLPVAPGFSWTYRVPGSKPRTPWTVGKQDRFEFAYSAEGEPRHLVGYDLRGTDLGVARLTSRDDLGGLFVRREIGYGGAPAWVPDLWLPLEGPEEFTFNTSQGGCSYWKVHGRRSGPEVVEVPAGRFDALRFDLKGLGVTTVWLARGVGMVKIAGWPASSSSDGQVLELHEHVTRLKP